MVHTVKTVKYCRVSGCRYSNSHLTSAHTCGKCQATGHGCVECGKTNLVARLRNQSVNDALPQRLHCQIPNCSNVSTHSSSAHKCHICNGFGHDNEYHDQNHQILSPIPRVAPGAPRVTSLPAPYSTSPLPPLAPPSSPVSHPPSPISFQPRQLSLVLTCPLCRQRNEIPANQNKVVGVDNRCVICWDHPSDVFMPACGHICLCQECAQRMGEMDQASDVSDMIIPPIDTARQIFGNQGGSLYVIIPAGMGCMWYLRRSGVARPIETFFMHNDDWGQYGVTTDRTSILRTFIRGYYLINN